MAKGKRETRGRSAGAGVIPKVRKVLTIDGAGRFAVIEESVPDVGQGTVLVEVESSLVSPGTELGGVPEMRRSPDAKAPKRPFGYGNAGVVMLPPRRLRLVDDIRGRYSGARRCASSRCRRSSSRGPICRV